MSLSNSPPDVGEQLMSFALDKQYHIDGDYEASQSFPQDALGKRLDRYMISLLTGNQTTVENIVLHQGSYGLPPTTMANHMIQSFFRNFAPLYPITEELHFGTMYQQYAQNPLSLDEQSQAFVNMVLAVGSAVADDNFDLAESSDVSYIRESLFSQAMASSHTLHGQVSLQNAQIMILLSFYLLALKNLSTAWFWCGCAIRHLKSFGLRSQPSVPNDDESLKDKLLWSCFVLEKQLSLLQFRSDMLLLEDDIRPPNEHLKTKHPLLYLRVQLASLTHRFCALVKPGTMNPVDLADNIEQLYVDISAWSDSLQAGYQPGGDIYADLSEYQFVLLIHLEYHGLLTAMFTTLDTTARLLPKYLNTKKHRSIRIRNQSTIRMTNARRLLQTVIAMIDTSIHGPKIICWLNAMEIIPSCSMIYAQLMKRPSLLSARADAEILSAASHVMTRYLSETAEKKVIADILYHMAITGMNAVNNSRPSPGGHSSASPSSRSSRQTEIEHNLSMPLSEQAPGNSNTPLGFYFNMDDRL